MNNKIIPQKFKFNVGNNEEKRLKQNSRYDKTNPQREIFEFFDNNKSYKNCNIISINKKDILKEKIKNFINHRKEVPIKSNKIMSPKISIIKKNLSYKSNIKRSNSLRKLNNANSLSKINKESINNKISSINDFEAPLPKNINTNFFKSNILSARNNSIRSKLFSQNNNISKIKLKKSSSLKQYNYLTPKEDKIIQYPEKGRNNITNKSDEQSKDKYLINNKIKILSGKYVDIYKEFNLNNGFSVSYFQKANQFNEYSKFDIIEYNSKYPLSSNEFKIAFNSGDFNIPLVSSSINFKGNYKK